VLLTPRAAAGAPLTAYSGVAYFGDKTNSESLVKREGTVAQVHDF
jgi:hypothetical protein